MLRDGTRIARCTVARLMRQTELKGVIRGKAVKTTVNYETAPCPLHSVNRQFQAPAPNILSSPGLLATW